MAPVAREDITDLAKATTDGGWTRATLPTVAVLVQDTVRQRTPSRRAGSHRTKGVTETAAPGNGSLFFLEIGTEVQSPWLTSESSRGLGLPRPSRPPLAAA